MSEVIRVFLADDDAEFRGVYRRIFTRTDGFTVCRRTRKNAQ